MSIRRSCAKYIAVDLFSRLPPEWPPPRPNSISNGQWWRHSLLKLGRSTHKHTSELINNWEDKHICKNFIVGTLHPKWLVRQTFMNQKPNGKIHGFTRLAPLSGWFPEQQPQDCLTTGATGSSNYGQKPKLELGPISQIPPFHQTIVSTGFRTNINSTVQIGHCRLDKQCVMLLVFVIFGVFHGHTPGVGGCNLWV